VTQKVDGDKPGKRKRKAPSLRVVAEQPQGVVISLARGQGKDHNGLTAKQEAFAQGVGSRGETLAASYRAAYDAEGMSPAAVHVAACRLMDNAAVALRVNALVKARQASAQHDSARIRAHVIERLHAESMNEDSPPAARVRALELLGKLDVVGAFRERVATEQAEAAPADLAATLEARLRAVLGKAG
jgi:hypothetical protein